MHRSKTHFEIYKKSVVKYNSLKPYNKTTALIIMEICI